MKNFTVEQRAAIDAKYKKPVVNLVFKRTVLNKSLGPSHTFKQSIEVKVQACLLQDVLGNELDFSQVNVPDNIQVGDKATVAGIPAAGSYVLGDGSELLFEAGILKKIIPPSEPTAGSIMSKIVNLKKDLVNIKKSFNQ
ncbi:MAG: hypothetical protein R6W78_04665 [Bacteroidales bacterium]